MTLREAYLSLLTGEYKSASAAGKQAIVWKAVEETRYANLPPVKFSFIYFGIRFVSLPFLSQPFDVTLDVRPPRTKWLHQFGTIAKAEYVPDPFPPPAYEGTYPPFSGLFETGAIGVVRLSLAMNTRFYITGTSLKLFVDGKPSQNLILNPSLDPQDTKNFFELGMTDRLPVAVKFPFGPPANVFADWWMGMISAPRDQSVAHLAKVKSNGEQVVSPSAPYQVFAIPANDDLMQDPNTTEDFRELIGKIKPGTVLYRIHGKPRQDGPWIPIGSIRTTSHFVASAFDDRVLSYHHTRTRQQEPAPGPALPPPDVPSAPSSADDNPDTSSNPAAHDPPPPKPPPPKAYTAAPAPPPRAAHRQRDYLERIEGIGPKISSVLVEAGITTFSQLAAAHVDQLRAILAAAGLGALVDPSSWPEQARLADAGEWDALDQLQEKLRGGRLE
ncbi:MAG TPA: helix-hairpin-helix domain-containing protein [Verrucomicrobiae bacterium]|nr:helix-hairpin-helix domain-containing protein [Verrucomicrobiae bacterium]